MSKAYTCKCLNIWIEPQPPPEPQSPQMDPDPEFAPVFVGEVGISVKHPQVTLRTRSRAIPISGTTQCARYTSLTCLVCQTLVYRVHQIIPLDIEGKDGPQLPTDDWVEQEIMKSSTRWIEVHKDCLTGDAILEAQASSSFSQTFNLVLSSESPPPTSPSLLTLVESPSHAQSPPFCLATSPVSFTLPQPFLSGLRPLFAPHPFTPSHPVFLHFSNLASERSKKLRETAEEDLNKIVSEKRAHVEQAENALRREVEVIWRRFRQAVDKAEKEKSPNGQRNSRSRDNDKTSKTNDSSSPGSQKPLVAIRDFTPAVSHSAKSRTIVHNPRISSLSASLATSSFHFPSNQHRFDQSPPSVDVERDFRQETSSNSSSLGSSASRTLSTQSTDSSNSTSLRLKAEGARLPEPFKRSMDPNRDTATSFRYFTILEADKAREWKKPAEGPYRDPRRSSKVPRGRSDVVKTIANGAQRTDSSQEAVLTSTAQAPSADSEVLVSTIGLKGKRKVTFDVQPGGVTQKEAALQEKESDALDTQTKDLIFDLDDDRSERSAKESPTFPVFPLFTESPPARPRSRTNRSNKAGLPASLVTLRPASLPLPSHIRPPKAHHGADSSGQTSHLLPKQPPAEIRRKPKAERMMDDEEPLNVTEAEILKLVAASAPSHRGAWNRDSKAWQLFVRGKDGRDPFTVVIPEENEDAEDISGSGPAQGSDKGIDDESDSGDYNKFPIAVSLPIAINTLPPPKEALNLAAYETQETDNGPYSETGKPVNSTALRKAAYAERDRTRSIDPGALDFAAEDDDDNDGEIDGSDDGHSVPNTGERGRKRALKILQARSKIPAEGMWRSLA